jgi:hypothetical protein
VTVFQQLLRLFRDRFTESDELSSGSGFETNIAQMLGFLAVPGLFVSIYLIPRFMALSFYKPGPAVDWELRTDHLFFVAYSFAVLGFTTVFEWDMLFPDRRDFLVLTPFPIRLRELFSAKLAALGLFLLATTVAVNVVPIILLPVFSTYVKQAKAAGILRLMFAQFAGTSAAALFGFFFIAALQGVLINLTGPRLFRRISPWIQMCGMSAMVLSLLLFPIYSMGMRPIAQQHPDWLYYFPPWWFAGIYDQILPRPDPQFVALGRFAWKALGLTIALFCLTWGVGFRRHYRQTLESGEAGPSAGERKTRSPWNWLLRSPEERAIFHFSGITIARSLKHRLFLATYLSVGISFGLLVLVGMKGGKLNISDDGLRSMPLLITFFVISGMRAAFQFPADLSANWMFQMAENGWGEISRRATRKRVLASGLLPTLLVFLPMEILAWGIPVGLFHFAFQFAAGALLSELLFLNFDKVPFTCSYFPGAANLTILAGLYLYGFTSYGFRMADLELTLERNPAGAALFFGVSAAAIALAWRRQTKGAPIRFDAGEPEIQTLGLN